MPTKKFKILIAEDEKAYARALVLKLQHANFEVDHAPDGAEAVSLIQKNAYDLIMLDLVMPKMNGFDVLQSMKAMGKNIPVIILSNLSQEEDKKKTETFNIIEFIEKSNASVIDVVAKVTHFLNK